MSIMYLWMAETIFQLFLMLSYVLLSNNHNFYPLPNCSSKKSYFKKITLLISVRVGNFWTVFRKVDFCLTALKVWAHCQLAPSTNVVVEDCGKGNCLAQCIWEQERSGRDRGREWGMRYTILPPVIFFLLLDPLVDTASAMNTSMVCSVGNVSASVIQLLNILKPVNTLKFWETF